MLLSQITPADPLSGLSYDAIARNAPFLRTAQWYTRPDDAHRVKRARLGTTKTKITRSLNEANTSTAPTPAYDVFSKKIISVNAEVDVAVEDRGADPETELAYQTRIELEEASWVLQTLFFAGDAAADAEDFDGLANVVHADSIITGGVPMPVGYSDAVIAGQQTAIETLRQHAARVIGGASHMYMNEFLKIRIVTVAKNLGFYNQIQTLDGMIETIAGMQVEGAGYQLDGTPNLDFTEAGNTSSIYFVRWGEGTDLSLLTSVGVKARYAGQVGNQLVNNVNLDAVFVLQNRRALWQSTGWSLAAL